MNEGEFFAQGQEKRVSMDLNSPERVVKRYIEEEPNERKVRARFYMGKIVRALFPKNFPVLHQSTSEPHQVVMERKQPDATHIAMHEILKKAGYDYDKISEKDQKKFDFFKEIREYDPAVVEFGKNMYAAGIDFDYGAMNFIYDKDQTVVFVDTIEPWNTTFKEGEVIPMYDYGKLMRAIQGGITDETERARLLLYLKKVQDLFVEEALREPIKDETPEAVAI